MIPCAAGPSTQLKTGYSYSRRPHSSGAVRIEAAVLGSQSLIVLVVSVDVKQHWIWTQTLRAQELCESRGGRPGLPVSSSPDGLCGRKAALNSNKKTWTPLPFRRSGGPWASIRRSVPWWMPLAKRKEKVGTVPTTRKHSWKCLRYSIILVSTFRMVWNGVSTSMPASKQQDINDFLRCNHKIESRHRTNYKDTLFKTSALQHYLSVKIQDGMKRSIHISGSTNKANKTLPTYKAQPQDRKEEDKGNCTQSPCLTDARVCRYSLGFAHWKWSQRHWDSGQKQSGMITIGLEMVARAKTSCINLTPSRTPWAWRGQRYNNDAERLG